MSTSETKRLISYWRCQLIGNGSSGGSPQWYYQEWMGADGPPPSKWRSNVAINLRAKREKAPYIEGCYLSESAGNSVDPNSAKHWDVLPKFVHYSCKPWLGYSPPMSQRERQLDELFYRQSYYPYMIRLAQEAGLLPTPAMAPGPSNPNPSGAGYAQPYNPSVGAGSFKPTDSDEEYPPSTPTVSVSSAAQSMAPVDGANKYSSSSTPTNQEAKFRARINSQNPGLREGLASKASLVSYRASITQSFTHPLTTQPGSIPLSGSSSPSTASFGFNTTSPPSPALTQTSSAPGKPRSRFFEGGKDRTVDSDQP